MGRHYHRLLKSEQLESRRPLAADLAALDVNDDMSVTALDALFVINEINQRADGNVSTAEAEGQLNCDTNGDGVVTPMDVLNIVNQINTGLIAVPTDNTDTTTSQDATSEEVVSDPAESSQDSADDPSDDTADSSDQTDEINGGDTDDVVSEPTDNGSSDDTSDDTSDDDSSDDDSSDDDLSDDDLSDDDLSDDDSSDDTADEGTGTDDESECDRDGVISEVARRGVPTVRGHHVRGLLARGDLFANLDANGDGSLSSDEVPAGLWDRLVEADADASDTVTKEELQAYREARRAAAVEAIFERLDSDASGTITSTDVSRLTWRFLSRADADNDGAITIDELLAAPLPRRF